MINFTYYTPTKVVFGKNTQEQAGALLKEAGCKKALLHYGGGSVVRSGLLGQISQSLIKEGVEFVTLGGVVPNPRLSKVYEGIELCRKEGVDFILAVGGGSVIDSAKAIGYGAACGGDVWDFYSKKAVPQACLPIGAVVTIAAAGSEMSNSSVITNEDGWLKRGLNCELCRPKFAVMNPELTCTLPEYQTASGGTDILMHTIERYFTPESTLQITDGIAEALLKAVMVNVKKALANPRDYEALAELMWAGSLSHNGLTGCGGGLGDWSMHQLEHELGGMFDVAHGAGLAALWGSWARYVYRKNAARFAQFAVKAAGVVPNAEDTDESLALKGIAAMEEYFRSIGMPINLHELGIEPTDEQIQELAVKCSYFGTRTIGGFRILNTEDMEQIYRMANK